jgi:AraC-like DNA-binding protein
MSMAMILMTMLPAEVKDDRVANRSRWWMAGALLLLTVQFLLQYLLGLRQEGVVQAVMLNLICFVPCSMLLSMSVLNLQLQGRPLHRDWAVGGAVTLCISGGFAILALLQQSQAVSLDTGSLLRIEVAGSIVYAALQLYYGLRIGRQLRQMEQALDDYYAQEQPGLLRWMKVSIGGLLALALTVPAFIFLQGLPLALYGVFFVVAIVYLWFSMVRYIISEESRRMKEATGSEQTEQGEEQARSDEAPAPAADGSAEAARSLVEDKVAQWTEHKGYLKQGLTKKQVAEAMQLSDNQLGEWIRAQGYKSFRQWMNTLCIEEATRQLSTHGDFNIGSIADLCGISRSHFHRLFRQYTGTTPAQYQKLTLERKQ